MERNKDDLFFASRAGTFTFLLLCRMSSFSPTKSDSKWEKIYFSYFKWKNSNFQILSEKWKCDILIFVNSNCLDFTAKTFVPKANKQLSELCLWLLGDKLFLLWLVAGKVWTRRGGGGVSPWIWGEIFSFLFLFVVVWKCVFLFVNFWTVSQYNNKEEEEVFFDNEDKEVQEEIFFINLDNIDLVFFQVGVWWLWWNNKQPTSLPPLIFFL